MNPLFTTPIQSYADAEGYLFQLHDQGLSYHPEDAAASIVNTNGRVFTDAEAAALDQRMSEVFAHMDDPCAYLLEITTTTDRS